MQHLTGTLPVLQYKYKQKQKQMQQQKHKQASNGTITVTVMTPRRVLSLVDFLRMLIIEFPLAILIGCLAASWGIHRFYYEYYELYMESLLWTDQKHDTEATYYRRVCTEEDFSTDSLDDMLIATNETADQAADKLLYHGSIIFPKLISDQTAYQLREHILERNQKLTREDVEFIWLISQRHRWSYKVDVDDHPSVANAMNEIANHDQFRQTMEALFGSHPALVELTAITSAYGAGDQHFHKDNTADQTTQFYARSFADMYSVFIPLQDTTAEMGATDACPGLHICHNDDELCDEETALRISNDERLWQTGDAWIFQMSVDHRGPAHTAKDAPERVILILTFAARPNMLEHDVRIPSLETSYSLKMEMSGQTISDLKNKPKSWLWKTLTYLGIHDSLGWDYIHFSAQRIINEQFGFRKDDLKMHLQRMNKDTSTTWMGKIKDRLRRELFGGEMPHDRQLRNKNEETDNLVWKVYVEACIEKIQSKTRNACIIAFMIYTISLVITVLLPVPGRSSRGYRLIRSVFTVCALTAPFLGLVFMAYHRLETSQWGRDIRTGRIFDRPFLDPDIPSAWQVPSKMGPTLFPWKNDILIPTRLDAPGLAAKNRFLEISHPGNRLWKSLLDQHAQVYLTTIPLVQEAIITSIHNEILKTGEFLLQNHEGNWVILNDFESRKYTRRKLLEYLPLVGVLGKSMREIESNLRHGRNRHTALYRHHLPALLHRMMQTIYQEKPDMTKEKYTENIVKTPFHIWKIPELPGISSPSISKRVFGVAPIKGVVRHNWSVDDYVIAFDGEIWIEGMVQKVINDTHSWYYDIELDNGEYLTGVSESLIRFYSDVMLVEGRVEQNDHRPPSRIVRVTSEGRVAREEL